MVTKKVKEFVPPKNLAACADAYYEKREARLAKEREAAVLQKEESACREYLINSLPKSQASGISGKLARVLVEDKEIIVMEDWPAFYEYMRKNSAKNPGVWSMMQRRVNEAAIREVLDAGKPVPGAKKGTVPVLRLNKL